MSKRCWLRVAKANVVVEAKEEKLFIGSIHTSRIFVCFTKNICYHVAAWDQCECVFCIGPKFVLVHHTSKEQLSNPAWDKRQN